MRSGPHSDPRPDSSYLRGRSAREQRTPGPPHTQVSAAVVSLQTGLPTRLPGTRSRSTHSIADQPAVMCRALRCQHPQMAPQQKTNYANRLDSLKQVLKPYHDNNANCLRAITRSARINLNKHWKSLENLFVASHDHKERAQNVANERLENRENAKPMANNETSDAIEKMRHLRVDR